MTRVVGPILVKGGPCPGPRNRRGREGKWKPVYDAALSLMPGEWFAVPMPPTANKAMRLGCVCAIRKWIRDHDLGDSVEVYRDEADTVIVKAKGLQVRTT